MRRSHIIALVVFLVAAGVVASLSPRRVQSAQATFLNLLSPFLRTGSGLQMRIAKFTEDLQTLQQLEQQNAALLLENRNLKATNLLLRDLAEENKRLRRALDYRERSVFELVPAEIVTRDATTWWSTVKVNRGFQDGIDSEMAVLTEEGLVGKTTTVARNLSVVLLLTDETCKVAASVEGTREQGILSGMRINDTLSPTLELRFLSKEANLKPGQRVFSSGAGGVFPSGVLLGTVKSFQTSNLDGRAEVIPAVDLTSIRDVFIVKARKEGE